MWAPANLRHLSKGTDVAENDREEPAARAETFKADVFISYASHDAPLANVIVEALEMHGIRCWIAPRNVVPGSLYADEIIRAINDANVVVLLLSEHAIASSHVGKEIERASSKRRRIIALRIDSASLNRAFELLPERVAVDRPAFGGRRRRGGAVDDGCSASPRTVCGNWCTYSIQ
jgi:hypothetical protein